MDAEFFQKIGHANISKFQKKLIDQCPDIGDIRTDEKITIDDHEKRSLKVVIG
jgi:hypothetical protein